MSEFSTHIYTTGDSLPRGLLTGNFFHSPTLFAMSVQTPRHKPYLITVEDERQGVAAQLLALVRYRSSLFPPYFYMHCRVLGEGVYRDPSPESQNHLFGMMVRALCARLSSHVLYMEVSNLSHKMFGYREFRENGFFPVRWMSIHNSLHSKEPSLRLLPATKEHIASAYRRGVETKEISTEAEFQAFSKLLRHHNWLKPRRYVPHDNFFRQIMENGNGRLCVTKYRGHVIGCTAVAYSQRQAYLWYSAFRRKSFAWLHPAHVTIWHAIEDAYQQGCEHICFMDVGLPFSKNPFREFILSFGGKPVSTLRWFRCSIRWINAVLSWIYRD
jgi:hypothetical protein